MASFDQDTPEDSFEIEFSQLPGTFQRFAPRVWSARAPDTMTTVSERRRRYSRVAVLVAVLSLVIVNTFSMSGIFSAGLLFGSGSVADEGLTAHASGYSWFALRRRPLHLPTVAPGMPCPVTPLTTFHNQLQAVVGIGDSSIFVATQNMDANGVQRPVRSDFFHLAKAYRGEIVIWYLRLPQVESVLIRGAQLDGPHVLLFDGGIEQPNFDRNYLGGRTLPQLMLSSTTNRGSPVATWTTVTRVSSSGCYAYQVDTPTTSMVLVFEAIVEP